MGRIGYGRVGAGQGWDLAEEATRGGNSLRVLAERLGREYHTLRAYRRVARAFPAGIRISGCSFKHHQAVLIVKDPEERQDWLRWAVEKDKSVSQMVTA